MAEESEVSILIRAKAMGEEAIKNLKEKVDDLRGAIEKNSQVMAVANRINKDNAESNKDVASAVGKNKEAVNDLRAAMEKYAAALKLADPGDKAKKMLEAAFAANRNAEALKDLKMATEQYAVALGLETPALVGNTMAQAASAAATTAASTATKGAALSSAAGAIAIGLLVVAVAALIALLAPFGLLMVGAVVIMAAFVVGATAVAVSLQLMFGLFGALAFAVVMLTQHLVTAGKIPDPFKGLKDSLGQMVDTWGQQAAPMTKQIVTWLTTLLPLVQEAGTGLLNWFGPRLPGLLKLAGYAVNDLVVAFKSLGEQLSPIFDQMMKSAPKWQDFFSLLLTWGVKAIVAVVQALVSLANWFMERWPAMRPIVEEIGGKIADFAVGAVKKLGELVDWFIKNWPEIKKQVWFVWNAFLEGWKQVEPLLIGWRQNLKDLQPLIDYMSKHTDILRLMIGGLGFVLGFVIATLMFAAAVFILVGAGVTAFGDLIKWLVVELARLKDWVGQYLPQIERAFVGSFGAAALPVIALINLLGRIPGLKAAASTPSPGPMGEHGLYAPGFQYGGIVGGPVGAPQLAVVHGGEKVTPVGGSGGMDDTNELLALIYQVLQARLQPVGFNRTAYARPSS